MATYAFNSAVLFHISRKACERACTNRADTLVAIVFAAAGLESFVNEVLERLHFPPEEGIGALDNARAVAAAADLYGKSASLPQKVQLLSVALTGRTFNLGTQPYQDFDLLVALRNALVHQRPERIPDEESPELKPSKLVQRLISRGVVPRRSRSAVAEPMLGPVTEPAVARWAFDSGLQMVHALSEMLPAPTRRRATMGYQALRAFK